MKSLIQGQPQAENELAIGSYRSFKFLNFIHLCFYHIPVYPVGRYDRIGVSVLTTSGAFENNILERLPEIDKIR